MRDDDSKFWLLILCLIPIGGGIGWLIGRELDSSPAEPVSVDPSQISPAFQALGETFVANFVLNPFFWGVTGVFLVPVLALWAYRAVQMFVPKLGGRDS